MKSHRKPTAVDWPSVREAYLDGDLAVSEICTKFGLGRSTLYRRLNAQGWPRRSGTAPPAGRRARPHEDGQGEGMPLGGEFLHQVLADGSDEAATRIERLVIRLFNTLERQMHDIEHRLNGSLGSRDAACRERDARILASLVRTLERLCALHASPAGAGSSGPRELEPEAVARMRQAIARRIARVMPEGDG